MSDEMQTDTKQPNESQLHWLVRPGTIRGLWIGGILMLAGLTALSLTIPHTVVKFGIEATPAFYSWYGFITCVGMVLFAKFVLGKILSRKDTYYDDGGHDD